MLMEDKTIEETIMAMYESIQKSLYMVKSNSSLFNKEDEKLQLLQLDNVTKLMKLYNLPT
jgi:hypothetical protein